MNTLSTSTWSIILLVAILLGGALLFALSREKSSTEAPSEAVTLAGTLVCLPHADTSGPVTLECAFGLETDTGEFYALDTSALGSNAYAGITTGDRIDVQGMRTPRDALDEADRSRRYDIEGVIELSRIEAGTEEAARHMVPGGALAFNRPADFGLAVRPEQLPTERVVPPCSESFDYCLYYTGTDYLGTTLESAGVRILHRTDISDEDACLATSPEGYAAFEPETTSGARYALSTFSPLQNAGAGHASEGTLFRLAYQNACYEFETRIGTVRAENYPVGEVRELSTEERRHLTEKLMNLLSSISFTETHAPVPFPETVSSDDH